MDEVLADTYARLAELRARRGELERAEADVVKGLERAPGRTYFRGHLLEVRGLVYEKLSESLAKAGKGVQAEEARQKAMRASLEAVRIQDEVIAGTLDKERAPSGAASSRSAPTTNEEGLMLIDCLPSLCRSARTSLAPLDALPRAPAGTRSAAPSREPAAATAPSAADSPERAARRRSRAPPTVPARRPETWRRRARRQHHLRHLRRRPNSRVRLRPERPTRTPRPRARRVRLSEARRELEIATSERDCARACRALESMERAAQQVCELARSPEERSECASAGEQVDKARDRVKAPAAGARRKQR